MEESGLAENKLSYSLILMRWTTKEIKMQLQVLEMEGYIF